ncbi:MAG: hypothetical protein LAO56_05590 [Acidobacteriia bacterium]|nr:hypothetical protein [Terriglobia bacterium]
MKILELSRARAFAGILLFGLLAMTARNAVDPDLWWHLRTGQWIVETGRIPHSDPFSFTRLGQPWVSHEWLSEVVFYETWKHAGASGLMVVSAIVTTAGFMLLYLRCPGNPHWAAAATAMGALASAPAWGVRPQMFTFALASLLLWLLERGQERPWLLVSIPPMFLLWLNLHAGFALGPALMLAYGFGLLVEVAIGDTRWREAWLILGRLLVLVLACVALVPLNPSGVQLYRYPFDTLRSTGMRSFIVEWFSTNFHELRFIPFLILLLLLLAALAHMRAPLQARRLVPLVLTTLLALDAVRHIPIFVLLAIPVLVAGLAGPLSVTGEHDLFPAARVRPMFNGLAVVLMAGFALVRWGGLARGQGAAEAQQFPVKAVEALRSRDLGGQIFAYYDWGGYTIYRLYPQYRVFVDGRADLYGDDLLQQFQTAVQLRTGWRDVLERWNVRAVLLPRYCALVQALVLDPNWRWEYGDSQAVLLFRQSASRENAGDSTNPSPAREKNAKMVGEPVPNLRH